LAVIAGAVGVAAALGASKFPASTYTANRRGQGSGVWLNSQSVMVGPGVSGDGYQVPAGVLDIWQHVANGTPISAVLLPDTASYNASQGLTSECVSFVFRVVNPSGGWKMVPLLWNDSGSGNEEVDSPEIEFTPDTVTTALHFPTDSMSCRTSALPAACSTTRWRPAATASTSPSGPSGRPAAPPAS
jgi:hypothetical protein